MVLIESTPVRPEFQESKLLDEDFIKVFEPFRNVQKVLGSSRANVKGRLVTPPTKLQKCYTTFCIVVMSIALCQLIESFKYFMTKLTDNYKMFYMWTAGISAVLVFFPGCIIAARFHDNEGNINLYIKMQEIDRLMRTNRSINSVLQKRNQIIAYFLATVFVGLFIIAYFLVGDQIGTLELIGAMYIIGTFVVELSCCLSHISFFYMRVRLVNSQIDNYCKSFNIALLSKKNMPGDQHVKISTESQDFEATDTDLYIQEICRGFTLFKEQYRFQILIFCVGVVLWILFTFEQGIFALQSQDKNKVLFLLEFVFLFVLACLYVFLLVLLSIASEAFLREVGKTKHLSILIMCRYVDGPLRAKAKNMLKLIEETPPSFSVYGMWRMDARLVLDIFHIVTNAIVNIIQFTFL